MIRPRLRFGLCALGMALVPLAACGDDSGADAASETTVEVSTSTSTASPTSTAAPTTAVPTTSTVPGGVAAPNGRRRPYAPDDPVALATELATTERALRDPATPADQRAELGHRNQVAYRRLGLEPSWDTAVADALPDDLVDIVRRHAEARRTLAEMHPTPSPLVPAWEIVAPEPADALISYYREAEAATGIEWEYLAAINLVESGFGRIHGLSVAGAQGPMQFLPSTWNERGIGEGDIDDAHDAIQAAARYLVRRGGPADMERALRGYNNSANYVRAVSIYAALLREDERAFHVFYEWEVHYLSAEGDLWLPLGYREPEAVPATEYLARAPWSWPAP